MHVVRGFFRFAHIDGLIPSDPAVYARLPKVHADESRTQGLDRLELIRFLQVAQTITVHHGALTYLLGINALRASEAAAVRIEDYAETLRGHRVLHLVGKGNKPATMPITVPVLNVDPSPALPEGVRRRAHLRRTGTAALTGALAVSVVTVAVGVIRAFHPSPPPPPAPAPPLPLVERVQVTPHTNGDLVYPVDGALIRQAPDGGTTTWVTRNALNDACGARDCSIMSLQGSPDGKDLAVVLGVIHRTSPSNYSVYVIADSSTTPRKVYDCPTSLCANGGLVSWSPDSSSLAVSDSFPGGHGIEIVDVADATVAPRTVCGNCQAGVVTWSPDGSSLAYASPDGIGRTLLTGDASEQVDQTTNVASLSWSPDGTRLLVETSSEVRTINLVRRPYTSHTIVSGVGPAEGPTVPAWSPDGTQVSWFVTPGKHRNFVAEVWTARRDGSQPTRLTHSGCCVSDWSAALWSPDGKRIALGLSLDPNKLADLLVIDAGSGAEVDRVTGHGSGPMAWQVRP